MTFDEKDHVLHRPRFGPVSVSSKAHTLQWAEQASAYHGVVGVVEIRVTAEGNLMSAESSWTQSSFTGMDVGTHSIIWSATQSHIFSKYPEASRVMSVHRQTGRTTNSIDAVCRRWALFGRELCSRRPSDAGMTV